MVQKGGVRIPYLEVGIEHNQRCPAFNAEVVSYCVSMLIKEVIV
jgi:hypothetical protein